MDSNVNPTPSEAHPETMDFVSRDWCNFSVQARQPELQDQSIVLLDSPVKKFYCDLKAASTKMDKSMKMDDVADSEPLPSWKSNDVKSWIWMQQAIHPELNYNSCFRKKWLPWKIIPFKTISIKQWLKELKFRRKEEDRLQRAEVHAAISVAGLAAALAAVASDDSKKGEFSGNSEDAAISSAAALVAAQCEQAVEATGAKREQLSGLMGSAMSGTSASDIFTLNVTAAACPEPQLKGPSAALRGAAALKARTVCKNGLKGCKPVVPIEENNDFEFDFEKYRSMLANGAELHVETPDGNFRVRSVSIFQSGQAKVILRLRKLNLLKSKRESIILDMHAELDKDSEAGEEADDNTCYLIVLMTNQGILKLDMGDDYHRYRTWATTIDHMLMLSTSFTKFDFKFDKA